MNEIRTLYIDLTYKYSSCINLELDKGHLFRLSKYSFYLRKIKINIFLLSKINYKIHKHIITPLEAFRLRGGTKLESR